MLDIVRNHTRIKNNKDIATEASVPPDFSFNPE